MLREGWRSLLNKEWAGCVLHNLPILRYEVIIQPKERAEPKQVKIRSFQQMQASAADWAWPWPAIKA